MASSSSSVQAGSIVFAELYDVFISHRGPDVKQTLGIQLYDLLQGRGCRTFLDREEIKGGYSITSAIDDAICSSRVQIAIFSKGFAESSWCLDEVVLMLKQTDALFIPVFYGVEPWELRHIDQHTDAASQEKSEKKSQYAKAFADYQSKGRNLDKLDGWKKALKSAAGISGYEIGDHEDQDLGEKIVSRVLQALQAKGSVKRKPLHVAKYPVGLDELVQDFEKCCANTARMVGIFGPEGCGKSTFAKAFFNKKSSVYHRSSFLSERYSEYDSERRLSKDLFNKEDNCGKLKDNLGKARHLRFLIVIDNIDEQKFDIDVILPKDKLVPGSLVILITRGDQSRLRSVDVRYEMKGMDWNSAKDLFCSYAFRTRDPPTSYHKLVESFVKLCGGLPLLLIVLGAHVYEKDEHYWNLELEKMKKILPMDLMKIYKISFDGLDREQKQIFIDIACCFNKEVADLKKKAITIWKACGWSAEHALHTLEDKCLIKMIASNIFEMDDLTRNFNGLIAINLWKASGWRADHALHTSEDKTLNKMIASTKFEIDDHLRILGRQMADEIGPPRLWQPELLRSMEAKGFKKILVETKGRCFHSFRDSSMARKIKHKFEFEMNDHLRDLRREMADKLGPPRLRQPELLRSTKISKGFKKILPEKKGRCFHSFKDSFLGRSITYFIADTDLVFLEIERGSEELCIPLWIPLRKLHHLKITNVKDLWTSFLTSQSHIPSCETHDQATFELRTLHILQSPSLEKLPNLIEMFSHLEELVISGSLHKTDTTSLVQSLIQLRNLRSLYLGDTKGGLEIDVTSLYLGNTEHGLFRGNLDLRTGRDCSTSSRMDSLETIQLDNLEWIFNVVMSGEMCPKLQTLKIGNMAHLGKIELKSFMKAGDQSRLEYISISGCEFLDTLEGLEELRGVKRVVIDMPTLARNYIGGQVPLLARNYIGGLKRLLVEKIILVRMPTKETLLKLDSSSFSTVIDTEAFFEIERGRYTLKMKSLSSAISIYVVLVTSDGLELMYPYFGIQYKGERLITVVLNQHDSEGSLQYTRIKKGFKVILKFGEEGKALIVLKRIVDQLYS